MLHIKLLYFCTPLAFLFLSASAQAAVVVGEECDTLGASQMATDETSIAACLRETAGSESLIWKSITSNGLDISEGIMCRYVAATQTTIWYKAFGKGKYVGSPTYSLTSRTPCEGYSIVNISSTGSISPDCPQGTKLIMTPTARAIGTQKDNFNTYYYTPVIFNCIGTD